MTEKPNTKLSPAQTHVLERMRDGWELGLSTTGNGRYWLQRGGCGRGGDTERVNTNVANALYQRRLIRVARNEFPLQTFELVGKATP